MIPPAALASAGEVGHFVDVAPQAGLTSFASAGGLIVDDFDNDGRFDVVTSSIDSCEAMHYFHRGADGTFVDQSGSGRRERAAQRPEHHAGRLQQRRLHGHPGAARRLGVPAAQVAAAQQLQRHVHRRDRGERPGASPRRARRPRSGPTSTTTASSICSSATRTARRSCSSTRATARSRTSRTPPASIAPRSPRAWRPATTTTTAGRTSTSRTIDGANFLYHNNHNGTFTEVGRAAGVPAPWRRASPTWFFDYDNDGWPDLFVDQLLHVGRRDRPHLPRPAAQRADAQAVSQPGRRHVPGRHAEVGLDKVFMPMGANFGDIDNDGFLDIYLGTGNPSFASLVAAACCCTTRAGSRSSTSPPRPAPASCTRGTASPSPTSTTTATRTSSSKSAARRPATPTRCGCSRTPATATTGSALKLVGVKTNRAAIGARIKVTVENGGGGTRAIYRTVGSGGSFGASPLEQHIGLGRAARIVDIEIWWPTTNTRQHVRHPDKNQWLEITEGSPNAVKLSRPRLPLGRAGGEVSPAR